MKLTEDDIIDYRVTNDSPFLGLLIRVDWNSKDSLRKEILENQIFREKLYQNIDKCFLEQVGSETMVCSKEVFERNQEIVERLKRFRDGCRLFTTKEMDIVDSLMKHWANQILGEKE